MRYKTTGFLRTFMLLIMGCATLMTWGQQADLRKMSALLRDITSGATASTRHAPEADRMVCAFVKMQGDGDEALRLMGCQPITHVDDIYIALIPLRCLAPLSLRQDVMRIEANMHHTVDMDTVKHCINIDKVYRGEELPQAYDGTGVVLGLQDVGFDLKHPSFLSVDMSTLRIKRFWDMLSTDTLNSELPVGADYTTEQQILSLGTSRDSHLIGHAAMTLGAAAGTGFDTPYRGVAFNSDLCLVNNAVSDDRPLIAPEDFYKYTYATDALGFKYIFDYAKEVGKPCVISFSEGSGQDFRGDDVLFYEMIEKLVGPGCILVASAGNEGHYLTYMHKEKSQQRIAARVMGEGKYFSFTAKGDSHFKVTITFHDTNNQVEAAYVLNSDELMARGDQQLNDTLNDTSLPYYIQASCYPSCYNDNDVVMEARVASVDSIVVNGQKIYHHVGQHNRITVEVTAQDAEVEYFRGNGYLYHLPGMTDATYGHLVHSPASAPHVICVGSTAHRMGIANTEGEWQKMEDWVAGPGQGMRANFSSMGPTFDGRIKPDVVAPGTTIVSSMNHVFMREQHDEYYQQMTVAHSTWQGDDYPWMADSGTSLSTPIVAGVIALWLQANPSLSPQDVMGIIQRTSRHPEPNLSYPNNLYGYGEIDAYKGLLDALNLANINDISDHQPASLKIGVRGKQIILSGPAAGKLLVRLYSTAGVIVHTSEVDFNEGKATVSLNDIPKGVYAVQVNGDEHHTGSTLVRMQ